MLEKFRAFWDPYSIAGLKYRVARLPDCPYKVILQLCIIQLERKKVNETTVRKVVEYARTGKRELLTVAIKMLQLSHEQIDEVLNLLKTGKIKDEDA